MILRKFYRRENVQDATIKFSRSAQHKRKFWNAGTNRCPRFVSSRRWAVRGDVARAYSWKSGYIQQEDRDQGWTKHGGWSTPPERRGAARNEGQWASSIRDNVASVDRRPLRDSSRQPSRNSARTYPKLRLSLRFAENAEHREPEVRAGAIARHVFRARHLAKPRIVRWNCGEWVVVRSSFCNSFRFVLKFACCVHVCLSICLSVCLSVRCVLDSVVKVFNWNSKTLAKLRSCEEIAARARACVFVCLCAVLWNRRKIASVAVVNVRLLIDRRSKKVNRNCWS